MLRYLLMDLDGTLLPVDINFFLERYLYGLAPHFRHLADKATFIQQLMASTMETINNNDPRLTNEMVFWENFSQRMGVPRQELEPIFNEYYAKEFPGLKRYLPETDRAVKLLHQAKELEMELIVATNPIFPQSVIMERLRWIGCDQYPYLWVTAMENMHYCKPNPNYFREIVERLSLPPEECLMVGNDMEEDLPAKAVGIKTCIVTDFLIDRKTSKYTPDYLGTMDQFIKDLPAIVGKG